MFTWSRLDKNLLTVFRVFLAAQVSLTRLRAPLLGTNRAKKPSKYHGFQILSWYEKYSNLYSFISLYNFIFNFNSAQKYYLNMTKSHQKNLPNKFTNFPVRLIKKTKTVKLHAFNFVSYLEWIPIPNNEIRKEQLKYSKLLK